jgi:hypothetical protein
VLENNTIRRQCLSSSDNNQPCGNGQFPEVTDNGLWTLSFDLELQDTGGNTYALLSDSGSRAVFKPLTDGGPSYSNAGDGSVVVKTGDLYSILGLVPQRFPILAKGPRMNFKTVSFQYTNANGQLTTATRLLIDTITDATGATLRFVRDPDGGGRVTRVIGPWGNAAADDPGPWTPIMSLTYNADTFLLETVTPGAKPANPSPRSQVYKYEQIPGSSPARYRLKTWQVPGSVSAPALITTFEYDGSNRLWKITPPSGPQTIYDYNTDGTFQKETTGKFSFRVTSYSQSSATFVYSKDGQDDIPVTTDFDIRDDFFLKDYVTQTDPPPQRACWSKGSYMMWNGTRYVITAADYKVGEHWARPEHYFAANGSVSQTFQYRNFGDPNEHPWDEPAVITDTFGNQVTGNTWDQYGNVKDATVSGGGESVSVTKTYDEANRLQRIDKRGQSMGLDLPAVTDMGSPRKVLWNGQPVGGVQPTPGPFPGTFSNLVAGIIDSRTGQDKVLGSVAFWDTGVAAGAIKQICDGSNCVSYVYDDLGRVSQVTMNGQTTNVVQFHPDDSPYITTTTLPGGVLEKVTSDWAFQNGGVQVTVIVTKQDPQISNGAERQISKEVTNLDQYGEYTDGKLTSADGVERPLLRVQMN